MLQVAVLDDVSTDQGTLGKTHDVELPLAEHWMASYFLTSLFGLHFDWRENRRHVAVSDLDALGVAAGPFTNFILLFLQFGLLAVLQYAMEDGCWHWFILIRTRTILGNE